MQRWHEHIQANVGGYAGLIVLGACLLAGTARGAGLERDGDRYVGQTDTYRAVVGADGFLESLDVNGQTLVASIGANVYEGEPVFSIVDSRRLEVAFNRDGEHRATLTYRFEPTSLQVQVEHRVLGQRGNLHVNFTEAAQTVEHVPYDDIRPLPVTGNSSDVQQFSLIYADGTVLDFASTGPWSNFNPSMNGSMRGYRFHRTWLEAHRTFGLIFNIHVPDEPSTARGAPPLAILPAPPAADPDLDARTVEAERRAGVFFDDQPLIFDVTLEDAFRARLDGLEDDLVLTWRILDHTEEPVLTGEQPFPLAEAGDTVAQLEPPLDRVGWFRLQVGLQDADNRLLPAFVPQDFSRLTRVPGMGERGGGDEFQRNHLIGLEMTRVTTRFFQEQHITDWARFDRYMEETFQRAEETGIRVVVMLGGGLPRWLEQPQDMYDFVHTFVSRYKHLNKLWELVNEPDGRYQPQYYIERALRPAYEAMRDADPEAKMVAPVLCGFNFGWLDEFFRLGGAELVDIFSIHPYGGNFDNSPVRDNMIRLRALLTDVGLGDVPIYFTESGYFHRLNSFASQQSFARQLVYQYPIQELTAGVTPDQFFYYYTTEHGYHHMFLTRRDGRLLPAAVARRMQAARTRGLTVQRQLNFGSAEYLRAFEYSGDTKRTVMLWAAGGRHPATLRVRRGEPALFDMMGNPLPASLEGDRLHLEVDSYPVYIELPPDATVAPVRMDWGANQALVTRGAQPRASSENPGQPASRAFDGDTQDRTSGWEPAVQGDFPYTLEVSVPGIMNVNRVVVWGRTPRDFDVQVTDAAGDWITVQRVRDTHQRVNVAAFEPVQTDRVRLEIHAINGTRLQVTEMQVFATDGNGGTLVNWAHTERGATAVASGELRKTIHYSEQLHGSPDPVRNSMDLHAAAVHVIDGSRVGVDTSWRNFMRQCWISEQAHAFPQWIEVRFDRERPIQAVAVHHIGWSQWSPQEDGIRDFDVQAHVDGAWQTLRAVRDNSDVVTMLRIPDPIRTDRLRLWITATHDPHGFAGVSAIEAFGPEE